MHGTASNTLGSKYQGLRVKPACLQVCNCICHMITHNRTALSVHVDTSAAAARAVTKCNLCGQMYYTFGKAAENA